MDDRQEELRKRLLAIFKVEAAEHVQNLTTGLLELEKMPPSPQRDERVESLFREIHSLKGAARTVNLTAIERICQSIEALFSALRGKELDYSSSLFDSLTRAVNSLASRLPNADQPSGQEAEGIVRQLEGFLRPGSTPPTPKEREPESSKALLNLPTERGMPEATSGEDRISVGDRLFTDTVRIAAARLNSILLQGEEFILLKLTSARQAAELKAISALLSSWKNEWTQTQTILPGFQRTPIGPGDRSRSKTLPGAALPEWLEKSGDALHAIESRLANLSESVMQDHRMMARQVDALLEEIKKALLVPCRAWLDIYPKMVHDLSRDCGKEADFAIRGGEIEVDRRILEEMKGPVIHLIRNCLDHGIEKPEERRRKSKTERGTVTLEVSPSLFHRDRLEIRVSDDGAGIDVEKVNTAALRLGLLTGEEAQKLNREGTLSLVFHSGVTTAPVITELSGRGLGLAIVREKVERLGGSLTVESAPGQGTVFRIVLPLSLITFRGITVRWNDRIFVIPTTFVERVMRVKSEEIKTVENRETIVLDEQAISLVRLGDALDLPRNPSSDAVPEKRPMILLGLHRQRAAFQVDEILGEQEISVKRLGPQLPRVRNIAGATVLGNGMVVPVLDVPDLLKSAMRATGKPIPASAPPEAETSKKHILVVEDSITARTLLKSILELGGYEVKTALDGIDAITQLRTGEFDLVVSDVDMPRMNGFELTAKIRQNTQWADLPVVLVTALQSREDRERGIEVGANAYIVKSGFDQGHLLDVVRRLV